jgi:hypothetical protein
MPLLRVILLILVIGWSSAQSLPKPIKSQIALGAASESEMVVSSVSIKYIPNTDKIVAAWNLRNLNQNSSWAYVRGAVASTSGDVIKQFDVSTDSTIGLLFYTSPLVVVLPDKGFAIFYYSGLPGKYYYMRRYGSDLNPVSEPVSIAINYRCIQPTAVIDSNGDIIMACPRFGNPTFLVYRINATGSVLDSLVYSVSYQNVHPSLALSGDWLAVSMLRAFNVELNDLRLYISVFDKDLNLLQDFAPFPNASVAITTSTSAAVNEPGTFTTISMALSVDTGAFFLHSVKFNSTTVITQNTTPIPVFLTALATSFNDQGTGLFYCSTTSPATYVAFPVVQTGDDRIFAVNQSDFHTVHDITTAESAIDTFPYADLVQSTTTWETGGAVAWPEISPVSGTHFARITIYGTYCGDFFTEGPEQCDGGVDCKADCTCPTGQISDTRSGCANAPVAVPRSPQASVTPVTPPTDDTSGAAQLRWNLCWNELVVCIVFVLVIYW